MGPKSFNTSALFALLQAGLWEQDVSLSAFGELDISDIYSMAEKQRVEGLVAAGIEHVTDRKLTKQEVVPFIGRSVYLEKRNRLMNRFIGTLIGKISAEGIYTLLVKGQGIAQCYERPLWRSSGDIDLLFDEDGYRKAVALLQPMSSNCKREQRYSSHLGMSIDSWYVEAHGSLRSGLSSRVDREIDAVQKDTFTNDRVRICRVDNVDVLLPGPDNDVFFVFTHFIKHFYKEKIELRQICDWCRLLWVYRSELDIALLKERLDRSGLLNEWRVFAALAVTYLGMPIESMPLFDSRFNAKGNRLMDFILFGGSRHKVRNTFEIARIFPWNTVKFIPGILMNVNGLKIKERLTASSAT